MEEGQSTLSEGEGLTRTRFFPEHEKDTCSKRSLGSLSSRFCLKVVVCTVMANYHSVGCAAGRGVQV